MLKKKEKKIILMYGKDDFKEIIGAKDKKEFRII